MTRSDGRAQSPDLNNDIVKQNIKNSHKDLGRTVLPTLLMAQRLRENTLTNFVNGTKKTFVNNLI